MKKLKGKSIKILIGGVLLMETSLIIYLVGVFIAALTILLASFSKADDASKYEPIMLFYIFLWPVWVISELIKGAVDYFYVA